MTTQAQERYEQVGVDLIGDYGEADERLLETPMWKEIGKIDDEARRLRDEDDVMHLESRLASLKRLFQMAAKRIASLGVEHGEGSLRSVA